MQSRPFTQKDIPVMARWLERHSQSQELIRNIPSLGFVVPGVGMAFLRRCEGNVGIMDSMITNSLCRSETRHRALERLFADVEHAAMQSGLNMLIGFTIDAGALSRATRHGFKQLPHVILTKQIGM